MKYLVLWPANDIGLETGLITKHNPLLLEKCSVRRFVFIWFTFTLVL